MFRMKASLGMIGLAAAAMAAAPATAEAGGYKCAPRRNFNRTVYVQQPVQTVYVQQPVYYQPTYVPTTTVYRTAQFSVGRKNCVPVRRFRSHARRGSHDVKFRRHHSFKRRHGGSSFGIFFNSHR